LTSCDYLKLPEFAGVPPFEQRRKFFTLRLINPFWLGFCFFMAAATHSSQPNLTCAGESVSASSKNFFNFAGAKILVATSRHDFTGFQRTTRSNNVPNAGLPTAFSTS